MLQLHRVALYVVFLLITVLYVYAEPPAPDRRCCITVPESWSIPEITCFSVPSEYYNEIKSLPPLFVGRYCYTDDNNIRKETGVKFLVLSQLPKSAVNASRWVIYYGRWQNVIMIARGYGSLNPPDKNKDGVCDTDRCWVEDDNGDLDELTTEEIKAMHESWRKWIPA